MSRYIPYCDRLQEVGKTDHWTGKAEKYHKEKFVTVVTINDYLFPLIYVVNNRTLKYLYNAN